VDSAQVDSALVATVKKDVVVAVAIEGVGVGVEEAVDEEEVDTGNLIEEVEVTKGLFCLFFFFITL